jgi:hypothetical protein
LLALYWKIKRYILVLMVWVWLPFLNINSQDTIRVDMPKNNSFKTDSVKADTVFSVVRKKHSPMRAALLSAVLPGSGQIYNKKYWKLPLVYAGIGISAYYFIRDQRWYKDYLKGYVNYSNTKDYSIVEQYSKIIPYSGNELEAFAYYVDLYRKWRDWSAVFLAGSYLLTIVDAVVDAYLFDYDINDNLSFRIEPMMTRSLANTTTFGLRLSFNLH